MGTKRKNDDESSARERKKEKLTVARTIAVQSTTISQNAVAGPSKSVTFDSLKGLPASIDVEKFVEARSFEISAMENAMENVSGSSGQRVWQTLPRHLRRRAASHDVRRVPLRLRERARAEMDPVRKKALGHTIPKRGKANRINRTDALLRRQIDKTWLETHIWHAKRMKMVNKYGYRLALHPTEKSFRPSHRASMHGSILHDASYYSLIELKGAEKVLKLLLENCCDCQGPGPGAKRFLTGARTAESYIYKAGSYPFDLIAPITILWNPIDLQMQSGPIASTEPTQGTGGTASVVNNKKRRKKGRGKAQGTLSPEVIQPTQPSSTTHSSSSDKSRTVWIRSHPAVFEETFSALQNAASLALASLKKAFPTEDVQKFEVEIADLRESINVFEIMGPKSNQVLKGALSPVGEDKREEFKKFWSSLTNLQTSGSLPRGMVIGFKVHDPRLKFPPKNVKPDESGLPSTPSSSVVAFPTSVLAQSQIWDGKTRQGLQKPRFKKKDLDERRAKNLVPGTPLKPQSKDDRIPVLLIQRSLESSGLPSDSQSIHGWTLIIPSGWSMPFFTSLTYTGTRVGGQRERQTQSFEAGIPYFPHDYPFSAAYISHANEVEEEDKGRWERKPPAKRTNFEKLGTRSPWKPDWEVVLGLEDPGIADDGFIPTQREATQSTVAKNVRPWLLRGVDVSKILKNAFDMFDHGAGLLADINNARLKRFQDPLHSSIRPEDLWKGALVTVRLLMLGRGAPSDLAVIYQVDDDEARKWLTIFEQKKHLNLSEDSQDGIDLSDLEPSPDSIIGYITSGNFSLSRGEGFTIGAIPVSRLLLLRQQADRLKCSPLLVKIRNRDGDKCRAARLELVECN